MDFQKSKISFQYNSTVTYSMNGISVTTASDSTIHAKRELLETENGFKVRLGITNLSKQDVFLENAYPLCMEHMQISDIPHSKWVLFNNGRHKNDLPSVCCIGKRDDAFSDAVNRLSEEGSIVQMNQKGDTKLYGDQITVIHASQHSLAISTATADIQLTEIVTYITENNTVEKILAGGEFHCFLKAGDTIYSDWIEVNCQSDSINAIKDYAKAVAIDKKALISADKPIVYSTWYYYGDDVTYNDVIKNLDLIQSKKIPFTHFQIDAGWHKMHGDWEVNEKFSMGMEAVCGSIKNHGYIPGIWTSPLIAHPDSELFHKHPDWMLRHKDGSLCTFKMHVLYYVLDCTNDAVIEWIEKLYIKLRRWGYTYHKLDFTRAFPIQKNVSYKNPYITPVQAYVKAIRAVRRGIGEDSFLLICGGLYQPLVGIANAERTGSDVLSRWYNEDGNPKIPYTVKQNILRFFMNEWWHNDPDSLMVRQNIDYDKENPLTAGLLSKDEAITFTANQYLGGLIGSTEPMDTVSDDRLLLLKHIVPVVNTKINPLNLFSGERFPSVVDVIVNNDWHTLCYINWTDKEQEICLKLDEKIVAANKKYYVSSFFGKKVFKNAQMGDIIKVGVLAPHSTEIVKVASSDAARIIISDSHFSMGGEAVVSFDTKKLKVKVNNQFPIKSKYTVIIPDGREFELEVPENTNFEFEKELD